MQQPPAYLETTVLSFDKIIAQLREMTPAVRVQCILEQYDEATKEKFRGAAYMLWEEQFNKVAADLRITVAQMYPEFMNPMLVEEGHKALREVDTVISRAFRYKDYLEKNYYRRN